MPEQITVKFRKAPKIIDQIKKIQRDVFLVGFKAETNLSKKNLEKEARKRLREANADMMVANDISSKKYKRNPEYNNVQIVDNSRVVIESGWRKKSHIAKFITKQVEKRL